MLKLFRDSKGSITLFSTLVLIPVVFFMGFFADLVRIKSYTNMAIMAADSYGEAYIAEYDNILKDTYGLFAITQEPDKIKEAEFYKDAIKWDFDPSGEKITGQNRLVQFLKEIITGEGRYPDGTLMPMKGVKAELDCKPIDEANLNNIDVLYTQINDFMKYRIVQVLLEDEDNLLETLESTKELEADTKIVNKKMAYDKAVQEVVEAAKDFYEEAKLLDEHYLEEVVRPVQLKYPEDCYGIKRIVEDELKREEEALEDKKNEALEEDEDADTDSIELSLDEIIAMRNDVADALYGKQDDYIEAVRKYDTDMNSFPEFLSNMDERLDDVRKAFKAFENAEKELRNTLDAEKGKTSTAEHQKLVSGVEKDLAKYDDLLQKESGQIKVYEDLVKFCRDHDPVRGQIYDKANSGTYDHIAPFIRNFLEGNDPDYAQIEGYMFEITLWKDYPNADDKVANLYRGLKKSFTSTEGGSDKGEKLRKKANKMRQMSEKVLDENEDITDVTKRNINPSFNFGHDAANSDVEGEDRIKKLVENTTGYFGMSNNSGLNQIMSKFFVTAYDFGMFSCRTTNVDGGVEESITGVPKNDEVNYLYRAEIEYILVGNNNTRKNLNSARNRIMGFRAVMNYMNSYTIPEVNDTIVQLEAEVSAAATPLVGVALAQGLRFAFSGVETAADWNLLKEGKKVLLWKKGMDDLSAIASVRELLSDEENASEEVFEQEASGSSGPKLNYKQYLEVMVLFFIKDTNVLNRTANVITLNMNNIKYKPGSGNELSELKYKLEDAHTAVEAYCTVSSHFVVMPKGFAQKVVPESFGQLESLEDNSYKFKVTRSY